jgi:alginate O-acetyltransferase complex protein AlgI
MVLSSLVFLYLFLPLNLILYYAVKNNVYRNIVLILFSLIFYAWGEIVWAGLLFLTTIINYFFGRLIEKGKEKRMAKIFLALSILFNLGLFVFFKYSGYLFENINVVFFLSPQAQTYGLPLGLSFYSFRAISYLIDIYRDEHKAEKNFVNFFMFMSLYHLVIGPIVRYAHIPGEIKKRSFDIKNISHGITRFCIGLFKKVFIANIAGEFVKQYMAGDISQLSVGLSWFGLIMFALQIYFDFSGYSDMAIGLGNMFGFHYQENFQYPYISRSITEFWRRWHISLSSFLRDYLFTPIAMNLRSWRKAGVIIATVITFVACGFWHGPTWNYVLWGLYFGILISLETLFLNKFFSKIPRVFAHLYFLFAITMGWALFYFTDLYHFWEYINVLFGNTRNSTYQFELYLLLKQNMFWLILTLVFCMPVFPAVQKFFQKRPKLTAHAIPSFIIAIIIISVNICLLVLSTSLLAGKSYNAFIYGNF